ncbi:capping protein inhibiting regulator of actin dynamics isoform X3 [Hemitrygon akajei]|uniref:capping protein inhibiting regulator of actin dynamics isoform X3 n=1 Tax=Hemitrygon akajei TaxID=2704970 RepID=UPI003BFA26E3
MQTEKKKQGKFQTFRKLFGKRRKVPPTFAERVNLKSCHSSGDVRNGIGSVTEESEDELRSFSTGTRALSHDSIFIPGGSSSSRTTAQVTSQQGIPGKVRTLQHQLERNIKFSQPLQRVTVKKMDSTRANSEVDGSSRSALEECTQQEIQLPGLGFKVPTPRSSRPTSTLPSASSGGTIESINLDAVPQSLSRLDNSAARHKLSVKPRNQRVSKKRGRLARVTDMQNVIVHEVECELEEKVQIHVENGQQHFKTVEGEKKEEKRHQNDEEQRCREDAKKYKWQEEDQTQYEFAEQKRLEEGQEQEGQRVMEEQKIREEEWRCREVEKQKLCEEEQRQRETEEQKLREEEQRRTEIEKQRLLEEEQRQREIEEQKLREEEQRQREVEERKLREEEQRQREIEEQKLREEEQRQREIEEQKLREEEQRREIEERKLHEEQRQKEIEEQKLREEEQRRREIEDQKLREEEQRRREIEEQELREEQKQRELEQKLHKEEQKQREMEEQKLREEEEKRRETEEQKLQDEEKRQKLEGGKLGKEEQQCHELKREKVCHFEEGVGEEVKQNRELEKQHHEKVNLKTEKEEKCLETKEMFQSEEKGNLHFSAAGNKQSNEEAQRKDLEKQWQHKVKWQSDLQNTQSEDEERQNDDKVISKEEQQSLQALEEQQRREELRWKELDERQTTSQPFSFQVASGEKQIIFPKVNLTPVTHPRKTIPSLDTAVLHSSPKASKGLTSSSYVPHTAILVTGAQLCGTAVDLKQIKDTACKSLLGFSEEKKTVDLPFIDKGSKSAPDMRSRIGKLKFNAGQSLDESRALNEWATIRAKILKSSNERLQEKERRVHGRLSDDWTTCKVPSAHGSLRKTLSANAKFSITPAWQKWADGNKVNDSVKGNIFHEKEKQNTPGENVPVANSIMDSSEPSRSLTSRDIDQDVTKDLKGSSQSENHSIRITDAAEGCKFAKDLPSFLVPSLPATPREERSLPQAQLPNGNRTAANVISQTEGMMDTSPFGIKLRRTHYSLRFHYEQQGEQKRKKRFSAGDSMDSIPAFLAAKGKESESCTVSGKQSSCTTNNKNSNILKDSLSSISDISQTGITHLSSADVAKHIKIKLAALSNEKLSSRPQTSQKPALAPKPTQFTAPPSPHSTLNKTDFIDIADHKNTKSSLDSDMTEEDEKNGTSVQTCRLKNEEETKDKKSLFPSINLPWRADKKTDSIQKEKPILQSRHSLDSSRLVDKVESAQPLWITLAMQKQKGFREQQASREERRQAREAKIAEKLIKGNIAVSSSTDIKAGTHYVSSLKKSTQDEEKKIATNIVSKVERREHLKKSATLPTSVTVEICDSVASTLPVKELPKRFSTPDAAPVSVEPAWLALAKRKAKAWSDCPQIIK